MESGKAYWRNDRWIIIPDRQPNLEHIETLNGGQIALDVLQYINNKVNQYKKEDGW